MGNFRAKNAVRKKKVPDHYDKSPLCVCLPLDVSSLELLCWWDGFKHI